jgi:hypothetical protein
MFALIQFLSLAFIVASAVISLTSDSAFARVVGVILIPLAILNFVQFLDLRRAVGNVLFKMHAFKLAAWVYPNRKAK